MGRKKRKSRIEVQGPLEILYDPRGPVTINPEVRETTAKEQKEYRERQKKARKQP